MSNASSCAGCRVQNPGKQRAWGPPRRFGLTSRVIVAGDVGTNTFAAWHSASASGESSSNSANPEAGRHLVVGDEDGSDANAVDDAAKAGAQRLPHLGSAVGDGSFNQRFPVSDCRASCRDPWTASVKRMHKKLR